jgi:hypothetical protein
VHWRPRRPRFRGNLTGMDFTTWLESTQLSTWIRTSTSIWGYPTILALHTFGLAILVGTNSALALRILGVAPQVPLADLERLFSVMWAGFVLSAVSGVFLFVGAATLKGTQLIFYVKLLLVACGMVNVWFLKATLFRRPANVRDTDAHKGKVLAAASLVIWMGTITAGRFMAYL